MTPATARNGAKLRGSIANKILKQPISLPAVTENVIPD